MTVSLIATVLNVHIHSHKHSRHQYQNKKQLLPSRWLNGICAHAHSRHTAIYTRPTNDDNRRQYQSSSCRDASFSSSSQCIVTATSAHRVRFGRAPARKQIIIVTHAHARALSNVCSTLAPDRGPPQLQLRGLVCACAVAVVERTTTHNTTPMRQHIHVCGGGGGGGCAVCDNMFVIWICWHGVGLHV